MARAETGREFATVTAFASPDSDSTYAARTMSPSARSSAVASRSSFNNGTGCGFFEAGIARGQCRTEDLALGLDGTPVQLLPKSLAPASTCSYRWWPSALH